jgi:adenosylcobyric acid synthase
MRQAPGTGPKSLMIQGTGSDVGKSLIVAGLARAFADRGLKVMPFKPQNMSNNAAVTADGGEIGRAQALQARAARVPTSVHMNPVLLKPQSEVGAQVVVQGRVVGNAVARDYQVMKPGLIASVMESYQRVRAVADLVLVEGAGSAAEVNLRAGDIANFGFARAADVPVILLGDIDRGGVIAQIVGTKAVIDPDDAALVVGFLVNKFRGDPALFAAGMATIADRTGWSSLGLIPHFRDAGLLPAEDGMALAKRPSASSSPAATGGSPAATVTIAVPILPHIANFDDLDPLAAEPGVRLLLLRHGDVLPPETTLVILPGSKATIADLAALRAEGWDIDIRAHVRRGGRMLGICGGYQMLGTRVADPQAIEGPASDVAGLGLLDVETVLTADKALRSVTGHLARESSSFAGYEMHVGDTSGPDCARPALLFSDGRPDGATSADGRISGHYVHGLFASTAARKALLTDLGAESSEIDHDAKIDALLDRLAVHIAEHVNLDRLLGLAR